MGDNLISKCRTRQGESNDGSTNVIGLLDRCGRVGLVVVVVVVAVLPHMVGSRVGSQTAFSHTHTTD